MKYRSDFKYPHNFLGVNWSVSEYVNTVDVFVKHNSTYNRAGLCRVICRRHTHCGGRKKQAKASGSPYCD